MLSVQPLSASVPDDFHQVRAASIHHPVELNMKPLPLTHACFRFLSLVHSVYLTFFNTSAALHCVLPLAIFGKLSRDSTQKTDFILGSLHAVKIHCRCN